MIGPGIDGTDYDVILTTMIKAASAVIDKFCRRTFVVDNTEETRYFDAWGKTRLRIDDLRSITSLKVDTNGDGTFGTELGSADYLLQPANKTPKLWIELRPTNTKLAKFPKFKQSVEISGLWGYGDSVPDPIKQACIMLVGRWFKRKDTAFASEVSNPELGQMVVYRQLDPDVKLQLVGYRRNPGVLVG
ncbi:MAG: hypothetical protein SVY53_05070 [Chloroflexota bacterium]|nr:hypothetical protein [Chloroflexota bacterium]